MVSDDKKDNVSEASSVSDPAPAPLLTVCTFDRAPDTYSFSPFATKLRFRLRHAGISYADGMGSIGDAPKKKIPYVRFADGELMGDSGLVIERLVAEERMKPLGEGLEKTQEAVDLMIRSLMEDRYYYYVIYERWYMAYPAMRDHGPFGHLSWGLRHIVNGLVYRHATFLLWGQGTGRHSEAEIVKMAEEVVAAMGALAAAALAKSEDSNEPFWVLGGKEATEADFTLYGMLSTVLATEIVNPFNAKLIKESEALTEYVRRIHDKYFSDVRRQV